MATQKKKLCFAEESVLAGLCAITKTIVNTPIKTIILYQQLEPELLRIGHIKTKLKSNSVVNCAKHIIQTDGVMGLARGKHLDYIKYVPTQVLNFIFEEFKSEMNMLKPNKSNDYRYLQLLKIVTAQSICTSFVQLFLRPLDNARILIGCGVYSSMAECIHHRGLAGLYSGFLCPTIGIFFYRTFFFGLYDLVKPMIHDDTPFIWSFALGYGVTVAAGVLSYPLDTINKRMAISGGTEFEYASLIHCLHDIIKNEGIGNLFTGATNNIVQGMLGALILVMFDNIKRSYISSK